MNAVSSKPELSDWPEGYVLEARENDERLWKATDAQVLKALIRDHSDMRFGSYIDLNIQQGFYLHCGNGVVGKSTGSDSGFVVGALGSPSIDVTATGDVRWFSSDAEENIEAPQEKMRWVLANALGPWLLTADFEEGRCDSWYWLTLRFLADADEAAFLAAFPEAAS